MSDDLTVFGGSFPAANVSSLAGALKKSGKNNSRAGDGSYLNFSGKSGMYALGIDGPDLTGEELFLVNVGGFEEGYICWKGGKPEALRLANISDDPIAQPSSDELGPFQGSDGWSPCKAMTVKDLSTGVQYQFKTNSKSGLAVFAEFTESIGERAGNGEAAWPIVSFGAESFMAQGNKNYKPIISTDGWIGDEQLDKVFDQDISLDDLYRESEAGAPPEGETAAPEPKGRRTAGRKGL